MPNQHDAEEDLRLHFAPKRESDSRRGWPQVVLRAIAEAELTPPAETRCSSSSAGPRLGAARRLRDIRSRLRLTRLRGRKKERRVVGDRLAVTI